MKELANAATARRVDGLWIATLSLRYALAAAFLSAVASRFGLWDGQPGLHKFSSFIQYTAEVTAFLPAAMSPLLAWSATIAETVLGIALIAGVGLRRVAVAAALLLALFAAAMAISFGIKSPLDYSVFSASAGALLLAQVSKESHETH